jgi:hypothetical protein
MKVGKEGRGGVKTIKRSTIEGTSAEDSREKKKVQN